MPRKRTIVIGLIVAACIASVVGIAHAESSPAPTDASSAAAKAVAVGDAAAAEGLPVTAGMQMETATGPTGIDASAAVEVARENVGTLVDQATSVTVRHAMWAKGSAGEPLAAGTALAQGTSVWMVTLHGLEVPHHGGYQSGVAEQPPTPPAVIGNWIVFVNADTGEYIEATAYRPR